MKQRIFLVLVSVLFFVLLACRSLPVFSAATFTLTVTKTLTPIQFIIPSTNLTMTELFRPPPTSTQSESTPAAPPTSTRKEVTPPAPPDSNCTNLARFISESIPASTYVAPGTAFVKTWTLKNIGTCTWGDGYALVFDLGDQMGGPDSVPMSVEVPPDAMNVFSVRLTAPEAGGVFKGFWRIQTPQGIRFGTEPDGKTALQVEITTAAPG